MHCMLDPCFIAHFLAQLFARGMDAYSVTFCKPYSVPIYLQVYPPWMEKLELELPKNLGFQICIRLGSTKGQFCSVSSSHPGNAAHLWWAVYKLVHLTQLQSIAFMWCQIYLPKIVRQCGQLSSSSLGSVAHLWWAIYQFDHLIVYKNIFYSIYV